MVQVMQRQIEIVSPNNVIFILIFCNRTYVLLNPVEVSNTHNILVNYANDKVKNRPMNSN